MTSRRKFDFGADFDEQEMQMSVPKPYQFFTDASDESGENELVSARIPPSLGRMMDEAVMEGKALGVPLKTKSDFVRFAITIVLPRFVEYCEISKKSLTHDLVLMQQASQAAYQAHQITEVNKGVENLIRGTVAMVGPDTNAV